jgi:3-mercaptopropionate dioxygenase
MNGVRSRSSADDMTGNFYDSWRTLEPQKSNVDAMTEELTKTESLGKNDRLQNFIVAFGQLINRAVDETDLMREGVMLLGALVETDDWLPEQYAQAGPDGYRQYLLHLDALERFSVVSFVWGPGQTTPIHDHATWGLIGMLRGAELEQHYVRTSDGTLLTQGVPQRLESGAVDAVSPRIGDLHRVSNAYPDRTSISIHIYGGNIGAIRRSVYEIDGTSREFVSGYS